MVEHYCRVNRPHHATSTTVQVLHEIIGVPAYSFAFILSGVETDYPLTRLGVSTRYSCVMIHMSRLDEECLP